MALQEQLRILSIFHYVVGGLHALFGSFGLIHFSMGLLFLFGPGAFASSGGHGQAPPPFFGLIFVIVGGGIVLVGWTLGVLTILAGRNIALRRKRTFSLIMGCINCALFPFGTVLGVFDVILLTRDDVRALYGESETALPPPL
jgi:hypothetical protein